MPTLLTKTSGNKTRRIHVAIDGELVRPLCGGGNGGKSTQWQEDLAGPCNCDACRAIQNRNTMNETSLVQIESLARKLSDARNHLGEELSTLNANIEAVKREYLATIKKRVARAAECQAELHAAIDSARGLFIKPRTVIFHGIKCGLRKGSGGINWEDDARVVALIRKNFPKAQADLLIKTTEKPIAKAIEDLPVADAKAIGCTVEDTTDKIIITAVDSAVDELVNALLKDALNEAQTEAEAA